MTAVPIQALSEDHYIRVRLCIHPLGHSSFRGDNFLEGERSAPNRPWQNSGAEDTKQTILEDYAGRED